MADGKADGKAVDLFPTDVLSGIAGAPSTPTQAGAARTVRIPGLTGGHDLVVPSAIDLGAVGRSLPTVDGGGAELNRRLLLGPTYEGIAVLAGSTAGTLPDELGAEAALSLLPAAILGAIARPAVDAVYSLLDAIPAALRRPLHRALGLLLDQALSTLSAQAAPLVGASVDKFFVGGALPASASVPLQSLGQTEESCGETAAAELLKSAGVPVALGDVDTQTFDGTNLSEEQELRRRGLTCVNGRSSVKQLKGMLASGLPVMVSVGWAGGGGHICVASGYDAGGVTVENWGADGQRQHVAWSEFEADWARHHQYATVMLPRRDPRLDPLLRASDLRPATPVYEGFTLTELFVTPVGHVYVEGGYRYVNPTTQTDVTVRVHFDGAEDGLARALGGRLAIRQGVAPGWWLGLEIEKLSLQYAAEDWSSLGKAPIAVYGSLDGPGLHLRAGGERGGFQAELQADLGRFVAGLGLAVEARVSVDADGSYRVFAGASGTL